MTSKDFKQRSMNGNLELEVNELLFDDGTSLTTASDISNAFDSKCHYLFMLKTISYTRQEPECGVPAHSQIVRPKCLHKRLFEQRCGRGEVIEEVVVDIT